MARAHRRRSRVLLGLPAPRQHVAAGARPGRGLGQGASPTPATTSSTSARCSTPSRSGSTSSPQTYRWSYIREFDTQARLVVVDSRAARELEPDARALLDADEAAWLDEQLRGDVDHLLVGTSLPFMLARGLHHLEAFSEALADGAWGERGGAYGGEAAPARRPRALGCLPEELPGGGAPGDGGGRGRARSRAVDGDVPVRRRAPQLRQRGQAAPATARRMRSTILQAVCSPDPQPALAQHALRDRGAVLRRRRARRPAGVEVDAGAGRTAHLALCRGSVVRQQPGVPPARRTRACGCGG